MNIEKQEHYFLYCGFSNRDFVHHNLSHWTWTGAPTILDIKKSIYTYALFELPPVLQRAVDNS